MSFTDIKIYKYSIKLNKKVIVNKTPLTVREGLILKCVSAGGSVSLGEISPLPGLSAESIDEAITQLKDSARDVRNGRINWAGLYPSVRFGIECALFKNFSSGKEIQVNALLGGASKGVIEEAGRLINGGFSSIKIKMSLSNVKNDSALINEISSKWKNKVSLRIDANRSWTLARAMDFAKRIDSSVIDYVEEPFESKSDTETFYKETGLAIALDESLREANFNPKSVSRCVKAFVVKPTIHGGLEKLLYFRDIAEKNNIKIVVSSSFETGVGISMLANMAALMPGGAASGLDTIKYFSRDLLNKKPVIKNGYMKIPDMRNLDKNINMSLLKEIS